MATFTVRIELHGASGETYERLHKAMEAVGYRRYVPGVTADGKQGRWALPTAEYDFTSNSTATQVRDHALATASTVSAGPWVLATMVNGSERAWSTKQI